MNIERNLFSLGLVALLALGASCSQDEAQPGTAVVGTTPLALTAIRVQTDDASAANGSLTRALGTAGTPDWSTDIPIGIFVNAGATGEGYAAIHNRKAEYDTERELWFPTPDRIWLNNHEADIAVYAPYAATQDTHQTTNPGTLKLAAALRLDDSKDLWGKRLKANNATYLTAPTELAPTLTHLYTRLTVTLTRSATYTATATVSSLQLSGKDLCAEAMYNLFAADETSAYIPTVPGSGFTATLTPALPIGTAVDAVDAVDAAAKIDLLLIPAALTKDITLTATIDRVQMKVTLPAAKFANQLEAGKWYQTAINLKPGKLDIASVSVVKWDNSLAEVDGGQAEFDEEKLGDYVIKNNNPVKIGKYTWAACNLRTSDAGEGNFEFEKSPWKSGVYPKKKTDITAAESNQCYWNWGCLKTPYDTTPLQGEAVNWGKTEDGTLGDPCAKIPGEEWKVPSIAQLEDLSKATRPALDKTVWVNGKEFTVTTQSGWVQNADNTIQGQVFVTTDGKAIFLPAAGYRNYDEGSGTMTMQGTGTYGEYWSSTYMGPSAYYQRFYSGGDYVGYYPRNSGLSVRCVKGTEVP